MTLKIGNVELENNVILAPMAGVTDMPYRILCREQGAGLVCMEMVSAKAILYKNKNTQELLKVDERERPVSLQLFGSDPDIVADIAASLEDGPYDIFDINMGCPVPKIAGNNCGSALMKKPPLCGDIVRAVKAAVDLPVTVKIRKGWDDSCVNAVELAKILEANGADAIAIHGRTRQQMYSGTVDLDIIRAVKKAVRIPVIGNGDITDIVSAANMLEYTGCDAVMIGRGAFGNPWLFRQINAYLDSGIVIPPPSLEEKMTVMLRHIAKMVEYKGEYTAMREARRHAAYYTKGLRGGAKFRAQMSSLETYDDLKEITFRIVKENQYDS